MTSRTYLSIGDVLTLLREEITDLTLFGDLTRSQRAALVTTLRDCPKPKGRR